MITQVTEVAPGSYALLIRTVYRYVDGQAWDAEIVDYHQGESQQ